MEVWKSLKLGQLEKLIEFQWENYKTKLDFMSKPEIESPEELEEIMRQKPQHPKKMK